ncbi:MAG: 4Fe-4S binding protein [Proteobacteria bacterium]|nr:4Fe-4S binding protein [Pseudomonadota bacterium]MBU1386620.1 4Fe-4S binding protein [Pseudomonadota bacterium]MBU1542364.1 4Fe-4S binding protein [Pseudomonadota bacterium]MBU2429216.1 4Fe-4S binding protein [Pseudomonadota bacterium]MBU2480200.1 4Fe-4S binding protein [Pseudomonadota bacterium]
MGKDVYKELLEVMKSRGGAYSGADIPEFFEMVEELFTPEEAQVNNAMPKGPFTASQMAQIMGQDEKKIETILEEMSNKGLCVGVTVDGTVFYKSARFMIGILEFQFMPGRITERDKKIARLIHAYKTAVNRIEKDHPLPAVSGIRVITVDSTVHPEDVVHTYDQVQTYIDENELIAIGACYCRHAALLRGEDIHGMPTDTCMQFGNSAQFAIERLGARKVSKKEAREVLDKSEAAGLIHMSQNMADGIGFICNCDRWHCTPVTQALKLARPSLIMDSGFKPQFDPDACVACETCLSRCPSEALAMGDDDLPHVNIDRCFGCAVCASGCPSDAISMVHKPGFVEPPKTAKDLSKAIKGMA